MNQHLYKQWAVIASACLFLTLETTSAKNDEYPVASISGTLCEQADAVVRLEQRTIVQKDLNEATEKVTLAISVLNEKGNEHARFYTLCGTFSELKSFSGSMLSATGHVIRKIRKSDLTETQLSESMATDNYHLFYTWHAPSYPYTVVYTYEIKHKNGVPIYPYFFPQDFGVAVEKAEYRLTVPAGFGIRYKSNAFANEPVKEKVLTDSVYTWTSSNLKAIMREPLCPPIHKLSPCVMIAPNDFCMDRICGNMSTWQNTGEFQSRLIRDKDLLAPETAKKVTEIAAGAKDERDIVKRLYAYLQQSTRYVSIQLGIGGWMPIPANKVAQTGFGDCKALTNYMKAMLAEAGIPSVYATINTQQKDMETDFSTMFQSDHVVLMVPLTEDSLWLECTSQQLPFNYVHDRMSGHHAFLIDSTDSKLCRIKDVTAQENRTWSSFDIHIDAQGAISSEVKSHYRNQETEKLIGFVNNFSEKDKINHLAGKLSVSKPRISHLETSYLRDEIPEIHVSYRLDAEKYASGTGSRLFIPINPERARMKSIFPSAEREHDILLDFVINNTKSITYHLPEGYQLETYPEPVALLSEFGTYSFTVETSDKEVRFVYQLNIPPGRYTKEQYKDLKKFFGKIDNSVSGQLVIVSKG